MGINQRLTQNKERDQKGRKKPLKGVLIYPLVALGLHNHNNIEV